MSKNIDILLINANASEEIYQDLSRDLAAIEPPIWAGLIANHVRTRGFNPEIIDCEAMGMLDSDAVYHIKNMKPRLIAFAMYGQQPSASAQNMEGCFRLIPKIKEALPESKIALFGIYPSSLPEKTLNDIPDVDFIFLGEGTYTVLDLLNSDFKNNLDKISGLAWRKNGNIVLNEGRPKVKQEDLEKDLPGVAWDLLPMKQYRTALWHALPNNSEKKPFAALYTSLGCPFSCLQGDTLINTIYGDIPIKELAKKYNEIPVYTYLDGKVTIAKAINISKTQIGAKLLRVNFDDGTYIDCTPDHKFKTFVISNLGVKEFDVEAKDLKPKTRIRSFSFEKDLNGYVRVTFGKSQKFRRARMVMEYLLGRKLINQEQVHHKDGVVDNDLPENLEFCKDTKDHFSKDLLRTEKLKAATRSLEQRINYRNSKLGKKNPQYKHGKTEKKKSRVYDFINHKVLSIEYLKKEEDVYCMEVPESGWFFANHVLVKNCTFCCINQPFGGSSFRYWTPEFTITELDKLAKMGITNIKIADEMFVMKPAHFMRLCELIIERGHKFNIWAYARVDITKPQYLETLKKAGVNWLALGIESGNKSVRKGVIKGRFDDVDIKSVVEKIRSAGINVIGNYIFGLPDDTMETMQETLDLAIEMNTEEANFYCAQAYPGSALYKDAVSQNWNLPDRYAGYSQHSYYTQNLPSKYLTAEEILRFRDNAWMKYHTNPKYLEMIKKKFGQKAVDATLDSTKIILKRKILEEVPNAKS